MDSVAVLAMDSDALDQARQLAQELALPLLPVGDSPRDCPPGLLLLVGANGLALQEAGPGAPGPVLVDFGAAGMRHRRRGGQNELLGRAVGVGKRDDLHVLDATAGLGRDAFVLADLGCRVTLCERQPVVARLLEDGLRRARDARDGWLAQVAARMRLLQGDVLALDPLRDDPAAVIYLDPMFPARGKAAAVKKEMQAFQRLPGTASGDSESARILAWALAQDCARVVVKRPLRAPPLAGPAPGHAIRGRAVRFDVYVLRSLTA